MNGARSLSSVLLITILSTPAGAWNSFGHMAVAYVAYQRLTDPVRAEVNRLIRLNDMYAQWVADVPADDAHQRDRDLRAFMLAATWADAIKGDGVHISDGPDKGNHPPDDPSASQNIGYSDLSMHKYWHFKDVPFSRDGTPMRAPPEPNIEDRIGLFTRVLSSPNPDRLRSYDLIWLLHLVGDVHQPLHCTSRFTHAQTSGDAGGNLVGVACAGCGPNLHSFWDSVLGTSRQTQDAVNLAQDLDPADPQAGSILDPAQWVNEGFELARSNVYVWPVRNGAGPYTLTPTYMDRAASVAAHQVALAGLRLANLLNSMRW